MYCLLGFIIIVFVLSHRSTVTPAELFPGRTNFVCYIVTYCYYTTVCVGGWPNWLCSYRKISPQAVTSDSSSSGPGAYSPGAPQPIGLLCDPRPPRDV